MSTHQLLARKDLPRPPGCENHLTRRQAAHLLGFASEFKIRTLERRGLLRSVRGPMRTAFYARAEVLALKAELASNPGRSACEWADADLLALLAAPTAAGRARTALDLVKETRITIERAERVYRFWVDGAPVAPSRAAAEASTSLPPSSAGSASAPLPPSSAGPASTPLPPSSARRPLPALRGEAGSGGERRAGERLARDASIRELRDPDPRVRQRAFERLRESRGDSPG